MAEVFCPRSITFTIPGVPGVQVTAVENGGDIDFTVDVIDSSSLTGDLRGLFFQFNEAKLDNTLTITDLDAIHHITGTQIQANNVIDLGNGANLQGAARPFDIGIAFGSAGIGQGDDISFPVHFKLSDAAKNLTLDDLAHLQFGARVDSIGALGGHRTDSEKIVALAPAAPDAKDDTATTHEDTAVKIFALSNDLSPDGHPLVITEVHQDPNSHGTVAITENGQSLTYTPNKDYAGLNIDPRSIDDSFMYCVSDGQGGEDHATVNLHVIPVADKPDISFQVLDRQSGDPIGEVRLHITATTTDVDGSEFLSGFSLGTLPDGVTMTHGDVVHSSIGLLDSASEDVQLLLPTDKTTAFDFTATAISEEKGIGDPDTASNTASTHIECDVNHNTDTETFQLTDQSIWNLGIPPVDRKDFLGVDIDPKKTVNFEPVGSASGEVHLKAGLQSTLHVTLGDMDATLPFDIAIDTIYNKTTDTLEVDPKSAVLTNGSFSTKGPGGSYDLSFIFGLDANAHADAFGISGDAPHVALGDFNNPLFTLVHIADSDAHLVVDIPPPPASRSAQLTFNWPTVNTASLPNGADSISSDPATESSPDIVNLKLNVLDVALKALGFEQNPLDLGFVDLLEVTTDGGINVKQHFDLSGLDLHGKINFENGTSEDFSFGSPLPLLSHAKSLDADGDGHIEFSLDLTLPDAQLHNNTALSFHVGFDIKVLDFIEPIGSIIDIPVNFPLGDVSVYNQTFGVNLAQQHYDFFA